MVTMAVILAILLPEVEAASTRRGKAARRFRGSAGRARSGRFGGQRRRRGRQDEAEAEVDLNAVDDAAGDAMMIAMCCGRCDDDAVVLVMC